MLNRDGTCQVTGNLVDEQGNPTALAKIIKEKEGEEKTYFIEFGFMPVSPSARNAPCG